MNEEQNSSAEVKKIKSRKKCMSHCGGPSGAVYGFGLIGAAVYYIQQATSFGQGALGLLKAIIWPAVLVYRLLQFLSS